MAELYLVGHGQASLGADNYDQLSSLGVEQAEILGQHFAERGLKFYHVVIGTQHRHRQTAEGIYRGLYQALTTQQHAGLNEYDFEAIVQAYIDQQPELTAVSHSKKEAYKYLKPALLKWCQNDLQGKLPETWANFTSRINSALETIQQSKHKRLLVVSSGGPI